MPGAATHPPASSAITSARPTLRTQTSAGQDVGQIEAHRLLKLLVGAGLRARGPGATGRTARCAGTWCPPCGRSAPPPPAPAAAARTTGPCPRSTGCPRPRAGSARPPPGAAQSHGWPSNVGDQRLQLVEQLLAPWPSGTRRSRRRWPACPSSSYSPSSSEPIASGPLLCTRYPATTQSAVRSCLILNITRLSGW